MWRDLPETEKSEFTDEYEGEKVLPFIEISEFLILLYF